ncbi:AAA family ATPase [Thermoanaerobacterium sp. R66]|uniref:AAA family ATPase n=1 Tax=Thermoanaerobacterium sp. R66 TaxID=2742479 RepID=UPI0023804C38|nr:AAA family ATPase [Thermoanaerobacterium sp. R66]MDE4542247.1 ATP-binding protein [Thermoanaerobacterium sp. R66]
MIHSIKINDFRIFKNISMNLGKYLTVISGKNALGKSTLLGMIGNTCELKTSEGRPIIQKQFRTEFSEIFKGSEKFDLSGSNKYTVYFSDIKNPDKIVDYRTCRITWPTTKIKTTKGDIKYKKRFRVIPEKTVSKRKSSKKYNYPVLYLGLSRLYPIGESNEETLSVKNIKLEEDERKRFLTSYKEILSIVNDEEISIDCINIGETDRKKGIGISTTEYDSLTNSAGQDNIGQILLAVLSFYRLKRNNPDKYKGGLLLIDELEATLHPYAQLELLRHLIKYCRELDLQIVFTTHSLTILQLICEKIKYNKKDGNINDIELLYITKANGTLEIKQNIEYATIYNDLNIQSIKENPSKIIVYSEDDETRWFAQKLLSKYIHRLELVNITMGFSNLLKLNKADPKYFSNIIFIVDGDVKDEDIEKYKLPNINNIIKLPGGKRPEEILYLYLTNIPAEHELREQITKYNFTKEYFQTHSPEKEYKEKVKDRERYKKWFNDYLGILIEPFNVFDFWYKDNKEDCDKFIQTFINIFNSIADRLLMPRID